MKKKISVVCGSFASSFEEELSTELSNVQNEGYKILDVKFSVTSEDGDNWYTALIIYEESQEFFDNEELKGLCFVSDENPSQQ